jgi:hypothetical protein
MVLAALLVAEFLDSKYKRKKGKRRKKRKKVVM